MFRKFDTDKSQSISLAEFTAMCKYYGMNISRQEAITIFRHYDKDATGLLDYAEFMQSFTTFDEEGGVKGALGPSRVELEAERAAFATGGGASEYSRRVEEVARREEEETHTEQLLARLARKIKNSNAHAMVHEKFRQFDINKDHMVDIHEFRAVFGALGFNLSDRDIDLLGRKFFRDADKQELNYEEFMGVIHAYADKVVRS